MLKAVKPALPELTFRQLLLADPDTMRYNAKWGGTIDFPPERWESWYRKWILGDETERFYRYLYAEEENRFVGEIAYHFDAEQAIYLCDVIVLAALRGRGYGREGLTLLCGEAKRRGIAALHDDIAIDNPAVHLFLRAGFTERLRDSERVLIAKDL